MRLPQLISCNDPCPIATMGNNNNIPTFEQMGTYSGVDGAVRLGGDQDGRHDQEQPGPRPLRSRSRSHRQVRYQSFLL